MMQQDYSRMKSLLNERLLQIKRDGIIVYLCHSNNITPAYLQCNFHDAQKLQTILSAKTALQLCGLDGQPLQLIQKKNYYTERNYDDDVCRVYLQNKKLFRNYSQNCSYILVKNNATISVLSTILQRRILGDRYFDKIEDFISNQQCKQIPMQKQYLLEYNYQNDLNKQQNQAIYKCFTGHLTFIKGPPGCGKTRTISRMVRMLAQRGLKILVGSISNIANQTLIYEIIKQVDQHNYLCDLYPQFQLRKIRILINYSRIAQEKLNQDLKRYNVNNQLVQFILQVNNSHLYDEQNILAYIEALQKGENVSSYFYKIYQQGLTLLMSEVNVVITTTINSFKIHKYTNYRPEVGIIDEAAQASWVDTYGFLTFGISRMVFVGDQKQLSPVVIGDCNGNKILKETMFQKLAHKNEEYFVQLKTQYRMHPQISQFPNKFIYQGKLQNAQITLKQRESSIEYFRHYPISFIQHEFQQTVYQAPITLNLKKGVKQYYNLYEGSLIMQFLQKIPLQQLKNISIITFYDMQNQILLDNFKDFVQNWGLNIKTIDGYQGGEKDYIIISTVRSNSENNPGFCIEQNRVNVALSRAKKGLIIFGNPATLMEGNSFQNQQQNIWGQLYKFLYEKCRIANHEQFKQILSNMYPQNISQDVIQSNQSNINLKAHLIQIIQACQKIRLCEQDEQNFFQKNRKQRKSAKRFINQIRKCSTQEKQQMALKIFQFYKQSQKGSNQNQSNYTQNEHEITIQTIENFIQNKFSFQIHQKFINQWSDLIKKYELYTQSIQQPVNSKKSILNQINFIKMQIQQKIKTVCEQSQKYILFLQLKDKKIINPVEESNLITFLISQKNFYLLLSKIMEFMEKTIKNN